MAFSTQPDVGPVTTPWINCGPKWTGAPPWNCNVMFENSTVFPPKIVTDSVDVARGAGLPSFVILTGPVSITKDGSPAPLKASTLTVTVTGGTTVGFSNITLQFQGGAPVHFGPQLIHGVVNGPNSGCSADTAPVLSAVTNNSYGATLSGNGTILVWGQGFAQSGGNTLVFQGSGSQNVVFGETKGLYFWDLAPDQINASLGGLLAPGPWTLTVHSACSTTPSNSLLVTIN